MAWGGGWGSGRWAGGAIGKRKRRKLSGNNMAM